MFVVTVALVVVVMIIDMITGRATATPEITGMIFPYAHGTYKNDTTAAATATTIATAG